MYRCQLCNKITPAGVKANRVVVKTRPRYYPSTLKPQWVKAKFKEPHMYSRSGSGYEIVREIIVCPDCATLHPQSGFP